jgi:hypothetical protein
MNSDLESAYQVAIGLVNAVRDALVRLESGEETGKNLVTLTKAFKEASSELRQLTEAIQNQARSLPADQQVPVLADLVVSFPAEAQIQVLRLLREHLPPWVWETGTTQETATQ